MPHSLTFRELNGYFFLLRSSFFRTTVGKLWSNYWPAPSRTDSIPERHQRQWIAVFTNSWVVRQRNRQKSTTEWTHSLTAVPLVRGHRTVSPRILINTCMYTRHPAQCHVLTWPPAKLTKNSMRVKASADPRLKKKLRVYTPSDANWLIQYIFL